LSVIAAERLVVLRGGIAVVREASLSLAPGRWFGLIGANGSGKTSLLRAIAGRLPVESGCVRIGGRDLTADPAARARAIGFAPDGAMLPAALGIGELLALVGGKLEAALARLGPLRAALGLDALLERPIGGCSAGMRQRAAIACAFAGGQRIVILDEPFNWLDPLAAYDTRMALKAMVEDGLTLVTALHDLGTLVSACDDGALLAGGQVAMRLDASTLAAALRDPIGFERETIDHLRAIAG
jgi:ABC-type multidrug transport system ATPase subunit